MQVDYRPGDLVTLRGREWIVLPEHRKGVLRLRPLAGRDEDATVVYLPIEPEKPKPAQFDLPDPEQLGTKDELLLTWDALRLKLRSGAGPFRSFGSLNFEPRAYQLVPLLMALKLEPVRLLIADDVGVGKTIEAGLIARELIDRGEIVRLSVICPPHLCDQWQHEMAQKFNIRSEVIRTTTASRLERGLRPGESIFEAYPFTVVSLDYIKQDRRRDEFLRVCPEFVIVDEAHTCVRFNSRTRHQRYQLVKGLAEAARSRGMLFLTATPHSGNDTAFYNLLGLLRPEFGEIGRTENESQRRYIQEQLRMHLVQRRRGDIAEWQDETIFPVRESRETTFEWTGAWMELFNHVLRYARALVDRASGGTKREQRMSWWAALALLRCISSSPAAAVIALSTRIKSTACENGEFNANKLEDAIRGMVTDDVGEDLLSQSEREPGGGIGLHDMEALRSLQQRAEVLRGPTSDPKLKALIKSIKELVSESFRPVVFCRYIATAHYVGEALRVHLQRNVVAVAVVTGEQTSARREESVHDLGVELANGKVPVLVATDCLSEGINLQDFFNSVVHYDLSWNPTRHEQREGRADRFGQRSRTVRTVMLYGRNNPVDGAVLQVIVRKAERIRKALGVAVPLPGESRDVIEAIMASVLLRSDGRQAVLNLGYAGDPVDSAWRTAGEKMTRTVFAQRKLKPTDVLPEWKKTISVLGGERNVEQFVRRATIQLGAPMDKKGGSFRLSIEHLPSVLRDALASSGLTELTPLSFSRSELRPGEVFIHRTHPLVTAMADYVAEKMLDSASEGIGARASAMFTAGVITRTTVYLLRLRHLLTRSRRNEDGRFGADRTHVVEECVATGVMGNALPKLMSEDQAQKMLAHVPTRNMAKAQQSYELRKALRRFDMLKDEFRSIAKARATELLEDHRRIRDAGRAQGVKYDVEPAQSVDLIGILVVVPSIE